MTNEQKRINLSLTLEQVQDIVVSMNMFVGTDDSDVPDDFRQSIKQLSQYITKETTRQL